MPRIGERGYFDQDFSNVTKDQLVRRFGSVNTTRSVAQGIKNAYESGRTDTNISQREYRNAVHVLSDIQNAQANGRSYGGSSKAVSVDRSGK